jgi:hypothetical protein
LIFVPETNVGCTTKSPDPSKVILLTVFMFVAETKVACFPVNDEIAPSTADTKDAMLPSTSAFVNGAFLVVVEAGGVCVA